MHASLGILNFSGAPLLIQGMHIEDDLSDLFQAESLFSVPLPFPLERNFDWQKLHLRVTP